MNRYANFLYHMVFYCDLPNTLIRRCIHVNVIQMFCVCWVRPLLCIYRLSWTERISWWWLDESDNTVLETRDLKFASTLPSGDEPTSSDLTGKQLYPLQLGRYATPLSTQRASNVLPTNTRQHNWNVFKCILMCYPRYNLLTAPGVMCTCSKTYQKNVVAYIHIGNFFCN